MITLEKLLLRLELASTQAQSSAVIPHATQCVRSQAGTRGFEGGLFCMLSFTRFKQSCSRGCHASFAFGGFLHTPPHPKQQHQRQVCVRCICHQHTLTSKSLNSTERVCRWSLESTRHGCSTVRVPFSAGTALRFTL